MATIKVTISGLRAIVGDGLDIKTVVEYTEAYALMMPQKAKILVARDTRLTGKMIANAVISTLIASGIDVIDAGIITTPTTLYNVDYMNLHGAIIVTASHNPIEWNALKFVGRNGKFFNQEQVDTLLKNYKEKKSRYTTSLKIGKYTKDENTTSNHIKRIERFVDINKIKKSKFTVACDYVNGTGLIATPMLLNKLGVKEYSINNENTGRFAHSAEPSPSTMKDLAKLVKSKKCDIGFTQDPDSDRLAIVCEDGTIMSEEYTLAICAKYLFMNGKGDVAVNLSTSQMIDDIAKEHGCNVVRTKIGEINVSSEILEKRLYFGGEGNGGIIVPSVTPGRDSLLAISLILNLMAITKKKISELVNEIPKYCIEKDKVEINNIDNKKITSAMKKLFPNAQINTIDGIKASFDDKWVHVRPSNTEPIVRIIAEAKNKKEAKTLIENIKSII